MTALNEGYLQQDLVILAVAVLRGHIIAISDNPARFPQNKSMEKPGESWSYMRSSFNNPCGPYLTTDVRIVVAKQCGHLISPLMTMSCSVA